MLLGPDYKPCSIRFTSNYFKNLLNSQNNFSQLVKASKTKFLMQIFNLSRVWPMVNSDSALYSICGASTNKGDLLNIVAQPNMTDEERNKVSYKSKSLRKIIKYI